MSNGQHTYERHRAESSRLYDAMIRLADIWDDINGSVGSEKELSRGAQIRKQAERLKSDAFNLMIVGEFKRGKSTLINAMLGKPVLPAKIAPCTAVITQVQYGDREVARLFFQDETRPPLEVPSSDLKKYVAIDQTGDDAAMVRSKDYAKMEVYAPLALCRDGVTVIDSPGLNEHETRTEVSLRFLTEADALLLVLSCEQQLSQSELEFIATTARQHGHDARNVFVAWNRYDAVRDSPDDDRDLRARSRTMLEPHVGGASRVYYVSALEALRGRHSQDDGLLLRSGVPTLEQSLETFLTRERGSLKLSAPLATVDAALRELGPSIDRRRLLLQADVAQLQQRYDAAKPSFDRLEKERAKIRKRIDSSRDTISSRIKRSYGDFVRGLRPALDAALASDEIGLKDLTFGRKELTKRLSEKLAQTLSREVERWRKDVMEAEFSESMAALEAEMNDHLARYVAGVATLRSDLDVSSGVQTADDDGSTLKQILAAAGGFALGGVGGAILGGTLGTKSMLAGLGVHLTVMLGAMVLGLNPVGLIVLSVISGLGLATAQKGALGREIKNQIAEEFHKALLAKVSEIEAKIAETLATPFNQLRDSVDAELELMLDELRGQVEYALGELTERRTEVGREILRLEGMRQRTDAIQKELGVVRAYLGRN